MKLTNVVEGLFGPIYTGAMIYALSRRKQGLGVTYSEAMGVGFRRWGSLWWTHVVAGVAILLGLLVLLVPGILFMIRYALIDPIVVLEGEKGGKATTRSSALTVGWKGQICLSAICVFPALMAIGFGVNALAESLGLVPNIVVSIVIDCCLDVISTISAIVLFLIYWEAVHVKGAEARGGVLETPIL